MSKLTWRMIVGIPIGLPLSIPFLLLKFVGVLCNTLAHCGVEGIEALLVELYKIFGIYE